MPVAGGADAVSSFVCVPELLKHVVPAPDNQVSTTDVVVFGFFVCGFYLCSFILDLFLSFQFLVFGF